MLHAPTLNHAARCWSFNVKEGQDGEEQVRMNAVRLNTGEPGLAENPGLFHCFLL